MRAPSAKRIGGDVSRYLSEHTRTGTVISVFRNGFNVLFDKNFDPVFVSIQTGEVPLHSWAIATESASQVRADDLVIAESNRIRFGLSDVIIDLSGATVAELRIRSWTREEAARGHRRMPLIDAFLQAERQRRSADPFQPQIDMILERWIETENSRELLDLLGLGSGSTPSGDDVLVGLLAGLTALGEVSGEVKANLESLRHALHEDNSQRTTQPSAQMIQAAGAGCFPEPLCHLLSNLGVSCTDIQLRVAVENVLSLGASSGLSMLHGLIVSRHIPEDTPGG